MQLVVVQLQTTWVRTYRAPNPGGGSPREVRTNLLEAVRLTSTHTHGTQCKNPLAVATGVDEVPRYGCLVTDNRSGIGSCKGHRDLITEVLDRGVVSGIVGYVPLSGGTVSTHDLIQSPGVLGLSSDGAADGKQGKKPAVASGDLVVVGHVGG
ncbi:hypothetical protein BDN67DRAFT_970489 [Paxillus ammoniavirescens]|nr:hypothetical protein BDN67DRAFT_970489 [Paxillus ammoniavirescens]